MTLNRTDIEALLLALAGSDASQATAIATLDVDQTEVEGILDVISSYASSPSKEKRIAHSGMRYLGNDEQK